MSPGRQRWTLIAACFSQFMILLDVTIVNVALPAIQRELDVSPGTLVWTINAYVLPLAAFILVGGTLGDRYGRKRVFALGFALFTLFSAGCALSTSDHELIAFRALQGVGAALLAPLSLSILVDAFEPERRAWAIGIWATIAGFGFGLGPVLGGALIEVFDWSAIFWVNVPIGVAGLLTTLVHVRESRDPNARRLDLGGAALASGALFCLTLGLVETDDHAWTSAFTLAFLGAAVGLGTAFLVYEARHPDPMLPLDFFRRRAFTIANLDYALLYAALAGTLFFVSLYFQNVKGFSALETGLSWLTMNGPFLLVSPFAGRLQARLGARRVVIGSALLAGLGVLDFALLDADSPFVSGARRCGFRRAQHRPPGWLGGRSGDARIDRDGGRRRLAQRIRRLRVRHAGGDAGRGFACAGGERADVGGATAGYAVRGKLKRTGLGVAPAATFVYSVCDSTCFPARSRMIEMPA